MLVDLKAALRLAMIAAGASLPLLPPASAQQKDAPATTMPRPGMPMHSMPGPTNAAEASMMAAMTQMSKKMAAVPMTGDPDRDFVAMMIPHHAGAIEMAQFELAHGKDPAMRKLAETIVSAQENEISRMQAWQRADPARER